jgi:hypothetical protein
MRILVINLTLHQWCRKHVQFLEQTWETPSYLGDWDWEDHDSRPAWEKILETSSQPIAGHVAWAYQPKYGGKYKTGGTQCGLAWAKNKTLSQKQLEWKSWRYGSSGSRRPWVQTLSTATKKKKKERKKEIE